MLQQEEIQTLDQWREEARLEIRNMVAQADRDEKPSRLRRRLGQLNPVQTRPGSGVSAGRIRQLVWRQVLLEELDAREAALAAERAFADLHERPPDAPSKGKRERLKLVGRSRK